MSAIVLTFAGRCPCGRAAVRTVGTSAYCRQCLPQGLIRFSNHQRVFALLVSHGVARSTANAMLIRMLEVEMELGLEFEA